MSRPTITYKRRNREHHPSVAIVSSPLQSVDKEEISREEMTTRMLKRSRSHTLLKRPSTDKERLLSVKDAHRSKRQKSIHPPAAELDTEPTTPFPTAQSKSASYFIPPSKPFGTVSRDASPPQDQQKHHLKRTSSSHLKENSTRPRRHIRSQYILESPFDNRYGSTRPEVDNLKISRKPLSRLSLKKHKLVRSVDQHAPQLPDGVSISPKAAFLSRRPSVPSIGQQAPSDISPESWLVSSQALSPSFDRPPSELGFSEFVGGKYCTSTPFAKAGATLDKKDSPSFSQRHLEKTPHTPLPHDSLFSSSPEDDLTTNFSSFTVYRDVNMASREEETVSQHQPLSAPLNPPNSNAVRSEGADLPELLSSLDLRPSPIPRRKSTQNEHEDSLINPTFKLSISGRTRSLDNSILASLPTVQSTTIETQTSVPPRRRERGATIRASDHPPLRLGTGVTEKLKVNKPDGARRTRSGTVVGPPPFVSVLSAKQDPTLNNQITRPIFDRSLSDNSSSIDLLPAASISCGSSSETCVEEESDDELLLKRAWKDDDWPIEPIGVKPGFRGRPKMQKKLQIQPIRIRVGEWAKVEDSLDPLQRDATMRN